MAGKPRAEAPSRPVRRRLRAPDRRERILAAALDVFANRGYQAAMADVAEAAGITRTVLYYYFPSKKDLFLAVLEARCEALLADVAPHVGAAAQDEERLRASLDAVLGFAEEHPLAWRMLCRDLDDAEGDVRDAQVRVREAALGAAVALLASVASRSGLALDDVRERVMAELVYGAVTSVVSWWLEHPEVPRDEVVAAMVDITKAGLAERS